MESDKLDNGQASSPEGRASETRLEEIRRTAELRGQAESTSLKAEARASAQTGYYGVPLLKPPPWKWEIPAYFFVGGMAGAAAVIAGAGSLAGADERLVRDARRLAALGGTLEVVSTAGRGTTIRGRLPLEAARVHSHVEAIAAAQAAESESEPKAALAR